MTLSINNASISVTEPVPQPQFRDTAPGENISTQPAVVDYRDRTASASDFAEPPWSVIGEAARRIDGERRTKVADLARHIEAALIAEPSLQQRAIAKHALVELMRIAGR